MALSGLAILVCLLQLLSGGGAEDPVGVAVFNEFGAPKVDSWLHFTGRMPNMTSFTVCLRVRFYQFMYPSSFISYAVPECDDELFMNYDARFSRVVVGCCGRRAFFDFQMQIIPLRWKSFCIRVNLKTLRAELFNDEQTQSINKVLNISHVTEMQVAGGGELYIGQEQDSVGGNFDPFEGLKAQVADLEIANEYLDSSFLKDYVQMHQLPANNTVVSFRSFQTFNASNVETYFSRRRVVLLQNEEIPFIRLFSYRVKYEQAESLCHALGGHIHLPQNSFQNDVLFNYTSTSPEICSTRIFSQDILWLGASAYGPESEWTHYVSKEKLNFTKLSTADDIRANNAHFALTFKGCLSKSPNAMKTWSYTTMSQSRMVACEFHSIPVVRFRGISTEIIADNLYYLDQNLVNPNLIGMHSSTLKRKYHPSHTDTWQVQNFWTSYSSGGLEFKGSRNNPYPFGRQNWTNENDNTTLTIVATSCKDGEFTCEDNSCVKAMNRCDLERDCKDGSDEKACIIMLPSADNDRGIPPPKSNSHGFFDLFVAYEIVSVHLLDLGTFSMTADVVMRTQWYDPTRTYVNLKHNTQLNAISKFVSSDLWKPSHEIFGENSSLSSTQNLNEQLFVKRQADPEPDDLSRPKEDEIFTGAQNPIINKQSFTITTKCKIELSMFPFDTQLCQTIIIWQCNIKNVRLLPYNGRSLAEYMGEKNLLQYTVDQVEAFILNQTSCPTLSVQLTFQNRSLFYVFYTFLPSVLLMLVGYMTFFFALEDFQDRVMVALTAMLVQTTFFTQVGDHLPRTSYLKLIDVWCVLCIAMLFCIILCLVIINHHVVRAERASVKKRPSLRDEPKKNGRNKRLSGIKTRKYSSEVRDLGEVLGSQHALKVCWRHDDVSDVPGAGMRDEEFDAGAAMAYKLNRFACWLFVGLMTALVMGFSAVALN